MIRLPKSAAESSVKSSGKSSQEADQVIATWSSLCVPTDPRQIGRISIRFLLIKTISTLWKTVDLEFIYLKKMTKYFILFQMCTSLIGANDDWMANQWMRLSISDHLHRLWLLSHLKLDVGRDLGVGLKRRHFRSGSRDIFINEPTHAKCSDWHQLAFFSIFKKLCKGHFTEKMKLR